MAEHQFIYSATVTTIRVAKAEKIYNNNLHITINGSVFRNETMLNKNICENVTQIKILCKKKST